MYFYYIFVSIVIIKDLKKYKASKEDEINPVLFKLVGKDLVTEIYLDY